MTQDNDDDNDNGRGGSVSTEDSFLEPRKRIATGDDHDPGDAGSSGLAAETTAAAALDLVEQLQEDFAKEGKTTCRDCLRTKTVPCPRVIEVAKKNRKAALLFASKDDGSGLLSQLLFETAHKILLDKYTTFLPARDDEKAVAAAAPSSSSLDCMQKISVVLRFVQLVLLLSDKKQQDPSSAATATTATAKAVSARSSFEAKVNERIASLLKAWVNGICELVRYSSERENENENDDETTNNDDDDDDDCLTADATSNLQAGPVFCYAFYSLLRMNEYVQTRGALVVPLWKGLCELAKLLVDDENDNDNEPPPPSSSTTMVSQPPCTGSSNGTPMDIVGSRKKWRDRLPPNLLADAIRVLGDFLQEGTDRLEFEAFKYCQGDDDDETKEKKEESPSSSRIAKLTFQGKFVGFLVSRMAHLLKIYFFVFETRTRNNKDPPIDHPIPNGVWTSLLGLRGMASALQLLSSASLLQGRGTTQEQLDPSFLKIYCELAAKAGKCVTDTLLLRNQQHTNTNHRAILVPALESLLGCNIVPALVVAGNDPTNHQGYHPEDTTRSMLARIGLLARTMGKVSALQQFLEIAATTTTPKSPSCGAAAAAHQNVEALLAAVEHLHSVAVPKCLSACLIAVRRGSSSNENNKPHQSHHSISTVPTTIVLGSLTIMTKTLRKIEHSRAFMASPTKRDRFYRLLVRWLAGKPNNSCTTTRGAEKKVGPQQEEQQQHPLSRELVVSLLHAHIVGCRSRDLTRLLSYKAKLLFDARTGVSLRRNIGALFVRLLQQSVSSGSSLSCASAAATTKCIGKEFVAWLNQSSTPRQPLSKKRKRRRSGQQGATVWNQEDAMVVSRVLGTKRGSSSSSLLLLQDEYQETLRKEFIRLSSDCSKEPLKSAQALLDSAEKNALLLAWLEGYVASSTTPTACFRTIHQVMGLDLLVDIVRPVLNAVSGLRFRLDRKDILKRTVLLYCASMRLSAAWANAFGDEGKLLLPLERVCLLIKHSLSKDPWQQQSSIGNSLFSFVQDQRLILEFEVLNLLGHIAKAIPRTCSEKVLKVLRKAFVGLLSSEHWAVSAEGVSSVAVFASDLDPSHQAMLPLCLPRVCMGLFQARASGTVWTGKTATGAQQHETVWEIVDSMDQHFHKKQQQQDLATTSNGGFGSIRNKILPHVVTTTNIAPGSYVLELPTQEDRSATVIFPPGPKSLQDIRYMLGGMGDDVGDDDGDDDDNNNDDESSPPRIQPQTLKRAYVTPGGVFKLLLVPS